VNEILFNEEIARGIFKMRLSYDSEPEPGQFVNLYLNDESRLLPRPISVCDWKDDVLTLVYAVVGAGTEIISHYKAGTKIRCSVPLGNGFTISEGLLVGGGVGIPPLLYLAKKAKNTKAVLGFQDEPFLTEEFPCPVTITTDSGSKGFKGNVVDFLKQADIPKNTQIFACGPKPMLKSLAQLYPTAEISLEERMGCGYGACVGCSCKTTGGNRKVCEDGPVFKASEVVWHEN